MDRTLIAVQNYDIYGYLKESMDRFGDDLNEEVLQYLTFEDKIRLECVSKQWQRCVYQKQYVIEIDFFRSYKRQNSLNGLFRRIDDERQSDEQRVVSVVKKCPNITKVILRTVSRSEAVSIASTNLQRYHGSQICHEMYKKFQDFNNHVTNDLSFLEEFGENNELRYLSTSNRLVFDSSVLSLIGRYCHRIKSLDIMIGRKEDLDFFQEFGHNLHEINFNESTHYDFHNFFIAEYLKLCPNFKRIYFNKLPIHGTTYQEVLHNLISITRHWFFQ